MIRLQTEKGEVSISDAALSNITGAAATSCFGVKGMAYRSMTDGCASFPTKKGTFPSSCTSLWSTA